LILREGQKCGPGIRGRLCGVHVEAREEHQGEEKRTHLAGGGAASMVMKLGG
jgi:hypothetical protein